jgi:hypothetical protein
LWISFVVCILLGAALGYIASPHAATTLAAPLELVARLTWLPSVGRRSPDYADVLGALAGGV